MAFNYWQEFEEGDIYHIYNRGNNRENIFKAKRNYWYFLSKWQRYLSPYLDLYAFCLIPNHFHIIALVRKVDDKFLQDAYKERTRRSIELINGQIPLTAFISDQFKRMFSSYALGINNNHNRIGSLFQKRFKHVRLKTDLELLDRICYVHYNPVQHLGVKTFGSWFHSSYQYYKYKKGNLVKTSSFLKTLDDNEMKARRIFFQIHQTYEQNNLAPNFKAN